MRKLNCRRRSILATAVLAGLCASGAKGSTLYWDADADTSSATGGNGTWDTTSSLWRPDSGTGSPLQPWNNDGTTVAVLSGTAGTVSLGANISAASLQLGSSDSYTINGGGNALTVGTIRSGTSAKQTFFTNINGISDGAGGTVLTIENNNTASNANGATFIALQGMTSMSSGALTTLNLGGGGTGASYLKNNQVQLWNPLVAPFGTNPFGNRNPWDIHTTINVTGDDAMISGSTPQSNQAGTHNFVNPVHLNNSILMLAAPVGNSLQFFNVIDSTGPNGGLVITGSDPSKNSTGQGAVVFYNHMTYQGPTRIMNTFAATNGGILRFSTDNALPTNNQLIWGDAGYDGGYVNLNGTDQTVGSIETTPGQQAGGIFDNNANHFHDARGYDIFTISGNRTTTYAAPIGVAGADGDGGATTNIQLNFPITNTGSTTLSDGTSQYSAGTVIAGGTVISRNLINDSTNSPVGRGAVTVSGTSATQFGTFGGNGQVIGPVSQGSFSHLAPGGPSAVDGSNPLTLLGGLTLAAGSNVDFDFDALAFDQINVKNGSGNAKLTIPTSGSGTVNLTLSDIAGGNGFFNGDFPLINYDALSGDFSTLSLANDPAHFTLMQDATNKDIFVHITGLASGIKWTGSIDSNWDVDATANWAGNSKFNNADRVTFDDTASRFNVSVDAGGVHPGTMTVDANNAYTFSGGSITTAALTKHLGGTLTLNNTDTFTGGAVVDGGTLVIGSTGALNGGGVSMGSGTTLALSTASNIAGVSSVSLTDANLRADGSLTTDRPFALSGTSGVTFDTQGNTLTLTAPISSDTPVPFHKIGSGTMVVAGSTMSGPINVDAGTLAITSATSNLTSNSAGTTVNSGATIDYRSAQAGYSGSGTTLFLNDQSTLNFTGESGHLGGQGLELQNITFVPMNITLHGEPNSRFVVRNYLKNTLSEPDAETTLHLTGAGIFQVDSGSLSTSSSSLVFSGNWSAEMDPAGVLSVGPLLNGNNTEVLVGLGYNPGPSGALGETRPVTISSGTLAVGADAPNARISSATGRTGAFRSPVILSGGAIASTGREYGFETGGTSNDAVSDTPVTARYAANITLTDNTTSKVLLYEPVPLGNYGSSPDPTNTGNAALDAQNINPPGPRSVRIVTDMFNGSPTVSSNFTWGGNSTLEVTSQDVPHGLPAVSGGVLKFERTLGSVTVGNNATLQIDPGSTVELAGTIDALSDGSHYVNVTNQAGGTLHVSSGVKSIGTLSGPGSTLIDPSTALIINQSAPAVTGQITGGGSLTKTGAGLLTTGRIDLATLNIGMGNVALSGGSGASSVGTVVLASNTLLDLADNQLIVTTANQSGTWDSGSSHYTGVSGLVQSARGTGTWNGTTGITSSSAAANANPKLFNIGVVKVGDLHQGLSDSDTTTFAGQTVHGSDTIAMYTYGGDANLDGKINIDDYGLIDSHVGQSGTAFGWHNGDFNYDGKINIDDYGIIDGNIGAQGSPIPTSAQTVADSAVLDGISAVPEPASLGLMAIMSAGLLRRRRRH
jgi:autotransporter-associated beta strand protein